MPVRFEWDPDKALKNHRKHKIAFEDAIQVFADANALFEQDRCDETGELRWRVIGLAGATVLLVAHTVRERVDSEVIRLISARPATRKERKLYEETSDHDSLG